MGIPLSAAGYWWARYGIWIRDLGLALAVVVALLLTWWSLIRRLSTACLVLGASTCILNAVP
jgi:hypothetical protein